MEVWSSHSQAWAKLAGKVRGGVKLIEFCIAFCMAAVSAG